MNTTSPVRIPGREMAQQGQTPITTIQQAASLPAGSDQLRSKMEGELRGMLKRRQIIISDMQKQQQKLDDINLSINVTAEMISRIDCQNMTQKLETETETE